MWKLNKAIDENETSLNANTVHHWSVTPDELPALTSRLLDYTWRVVRSVDAPWSSCTDASWTTWWSVMPVPAADDAVALVGREQAEGGKECRAPTSEDRHEGRRRLWGASSSRPSSTDGGHRFRSLLRNTRRDSVQDCVTHNGLLLAVSQPFHVVPRCHHYLCLPNRRYGAALCAMRMGPPNLLLCSVHSLRWKVMAKSTVRWFVWEKSTVLTEKINWKVRIIRQANRTKFSYWSTVVGIGRRNQRDIYYRALEYQQHAIHPTFIRRGKQKNIETRKNNCSLSRGQRKYQNMTANP
jgi:hypothetical protein